MRVAFYTLGCKVNQYETNLMTKQFEEKGYTIVNFEEKADIYVVNSCSVTNLSTRKSRQFLSRARKNNLNAIVVLVGCYSEELTFNENKCNTYDIALGNEEKKEIVKYVEEYMDNVVKQNTNNDKKLYTNNIKDKLKVKDISKVERYIEKDSLSHGYEIREAVKIEDGCNNFCSYCIIPYTRGRVRSRNIQDILKEVNSLVESKVKEIVIVGIEIASYGKDLGDEISLIDVIEEIAKIDKVERIRLGSIEPRWLTDENIDRLSKISKVCNHFHLSVQNLNNDVLKRMNRKYTREFLFDRVNKLKEKFKDVAITCDIIVGYINETESEFKDTLEGSKIISFSDMHVFKFSKRKHTRAYLMETSVDGNTSDMRSKQLISLGNKLKEKFLKSHIGKNVCILFEEYNEGYLYGYTSNYIKVKVKGDKKLWGKTQDLELISVEKDLMLGKII